MSHQVQCWLVFGASVLGALALFVLIVVLMDRRKLSAADTERLIALLNEYPEHRPLVKEWSEHGPLQKRHLDMLENHIEDQICSDATEKAQQCLFNLLHEKKPKDERDC